jgi:arsenical pump membrane protein
VNAADARSSADQNWSPFVLVAGLLLIGLVADDDGLFAAAGHQLARTLRNGTVLFIGAVITIGIVTALLNLDTSVAFLTPVLIYTARSRGEGEAPLLYGCLLLSNAGSLFLPGSNLTNLIVLGHLHLTGGQFFGHMWFAALAALIASAVAIAVGVATVLVVLLPHSAPFVLAVGRLEFA